MGTLVAAGLEVDTAQAGRLFVEQGCSVTGHSIVYVIGNLAYYDHRDSGPPPGLGAVAMQQGKLVAKCIRRKSNGQSPNPLSYKDLDQMATIGRRQNGKNPIQWIFRLVFWLFIHLFLLIGFENLALVLIQ